MWVMPHELVLSRIEFGVQGKLRPKRGGVNCKGRD